MSPILVSEEVKAQIEEKSLPDTNNSGGGGFNFDKQKRGKGRRKKCNLCDQYDCKQHPSL